MAEQAVTLPAGVELIRDVEFGRGGEGTLKLNLFLPKGRRAGAKLPTVAYIHGGAWLIGSRDMVFERPPTLAALCSLVAEGYVCAAIEYRLSQEAPFPAQIEDCKCAVRFLRAHAEAYGVDPERIGAWGPSAGGHLAALLGTSGGAKELEGSGGWPEHSSRVQAVVVWFGPSDLLRMGGTHSNPDSPESRLIGGPIQENKAKAARASPITYVSKDSPPFLVMHGAEDAVVPPNQSELLHAALRNAGVESELVIVPGKGHEFLGEEASRKVAAFFDRHLRP